MYEEECQFLENEYQHKFFEIKKYFQKRTRDIKEEDDKIENDYLREKDNKNVFGFSFLYLSKIFIFLAN